jgi:hypothetical protein
MEWLRISVTNSAESAGNGQELVDTVRVFAGFGPGIYGTNYLD